MKKAVAPFSEIVLTIGILMAVGIAMLQVRGVFYGQQLLAQEEVVVAFARDLENIADKAIGTTGDAVFVYHPSVKKYSVDISNNMVSIFDKISGKNASFSKSAPEIIDNYFEDCDKIFVIKKEEKIIITCRCYENGEACKSDLICCSGYCNITTNKCDMSPKCPTELKCPGAPRDGEAGDHAWIDINGITCCPLNNIGDTSGPVCSSNHCCPTHKPKWCNKPKTGNPRCVNQTEYQAEGCEEICPPTISQCYNQWHWTGYDGSFFMNVNGKVCDYYEVCHPDIQPVIKEIVDCCNNKCSGNCHSTCNQALSNSGLSSTDTPDTRKKCYGLYVIYGLNGASRWLKGYQYSCLNYFGPSCYEKPASIMIAHPVSGEPICTWYSISLSTLLRSVGYGTDEVYSQCGPGHTFNLVKFPGESQYRWVDTVGNDLYISGITSSDWYRTSYGACRSSGLTNYPPNGCGCQNDQGTVNCPSSSNIIFGASC